MSPRSLGFQAPPQIQQSRNALASAIARLEPSGADIKHRFYKRFIELGACPSMSSAAIAQYSKMIQKAWAEVDRRFLYRLIESMPDRVAAVIAANGRSTKY